MLSALNFCLLVMRRKSSINANEVDCGGDDGFQHFSAIRWIRVCLNENTHE